jgi:hypothetical protein
MAVGFGLMGCFSLVPLIFLIAFVVYLIIWLRDKTRRDETMVDLLAVTQMLLREIDDELEAAGLSARNARGFKE